MVARYFWGSCWILEVRKHLVVGGGRAAVPVELEGTMRMRGRGDVETDPIELPTGEFVELVDVDG